MRAANGLKKIIALTLMFIFAAASFGCGSEKKEAPKDPPAARTEAQAKPDEKEPGSKKSDGLEKNGKSDKSDKVDKKNKNEKPKGSGYKMSDTKSLRNTKNFSKNAIAHIFDGTINKKGKATGYHYSMVADSKGKIIGGTRSKKDLHGVFTAKVEVDGVKKDGFSSFYPEDWSPQDVVDAINEAYNSALSDSENPRGSLWIGHSGDLEIDMYLDDGKKILTAFPVFVRK